MLKRNLQEPHEDAKGKILNSRNLATNEDVRELLTQIQGDELLWVILMVVTGRRSIDVSRMKWQHIRKFGEKLGVMIPKDKSSKNPVSFSFTWKEFDVGGFDIDTVKSEFEASCDEKSGFVINSENESENTREKHLVAMKQRISRKSKFNLHALRARRAVIELMKGKKESLVKAKLGWKSEAMVRYYTILSADQVCEFENYESFCVYLKTQMIIQKT